MIPSIAYWDYSRCLKFFLIRDRMLIEAGYTTKVTVKWWGGGYAHPYLWKENKSDAEYKESWNDPRLPKVPKEEQKVKPPVVQKKNRGENVE